MLRFFPFDFAEGSPSAREPAQDDKQSNYEVLSFGSLRIDCIHPLAWVRM
jgi:hypothetical protein